MVEPLRTQEKNRQDFQSVQELLVGSSVAVEGPERARAMVALYRDWFERQAGARHEHHKNLSGIWTPNLVRSHRTRDYLEDTPYTGDLPYGPALFAGQGNFTETLFGGLAYHVDREVILSLGNRLTEIGAQQLLGEAESRPRVPLALQESFSPQARHGEQVILYNSKNSPEGIDFEALQAALVRAIDIPGGLRIRSKNGRRMNERRYDIRFKIPASISWDGREHRIALEFSARLPRQPGGNLLTQVLEFFSATNGRPAQHYQHEAATVIHLEELILARQGSIKVILDRGTKEERRLEPDRMLGTKLAGLLSQTAGGFFEKSYWQGSANGQSRTVLLDNEGPPQAMQREQSLAFDEDDHELRLSTMSVSSAPHKTQIVEKHERLENGKSVFEMTELRFLSAKDDRELMAICFNTGIGRGVRDLGYRCDREQKGRFAFRVDGKMGFSYGDFVVSKTRQVGMDQDNSPIYYSNLVLKPKFPRDMKNKLIILHVVHSRDGVYTETQIVPRKIVHPPEFQLQGVL